MRATPSLAIEDCFCHHKDCPDLGKRGHGNATDRHQNARKQRKTYCFSKSKRMHDAATYFVSYRYNFCWEVRTLRMKEDHTWSLEEWLRYPAKPRSPV